MAQDVGEALVWLCRLAGVFSLIKQAPPEIASLPGTLGPWGWENLVKHCSVMFCAPRWICALAAPAVPRWSRKGRKHRVPVVLPSPAQCKWQSVFPGFVGGEENSTANDSPARGRSCTYKFICLVYLGG